MDKHNCRACEIQSNDEQVKQMPMHTCGKDGPVDKALPKAMNGTNEHEGREEKLIPFTEIDDRARNIAVAWIENYEPMGFDIQQKHKLASDIMNYAASLREQLASERALRKELVDIVIRIKPLAEDGHAMHKRNGCHQEFLSEDVERLQIVESIIQKSKSLDEKEVKPLNLGI